MNYKKLILGLLLITNSAYPIKLVPDCLNWHDEEACYGMLFVGMPITIVTIGSLGLAAYLHINLTHHIKKNPALTMKIIKGWAVVGGVMAGLFATWAALNFFKIGLK